MTSTAAKIMIKIHFEDFLANKFRAIKNLSLSDFDINPFLIATVQSQLGMTTPRDLAEWLVRQRVERSMVTGFGSILQRIAREFSNEKPLPNLTARITRDGKIYNLIIKSGSKHNLPVIQSIQRFLLNSKKLEPNSIPIFGMCCGDKSTIGSIVKKHGSGVKQLVGKEFWTFISNDAQCYDVILEIATEVGNKYTDPDGATLQQIIDRKISYIEAELKKLYSDNPKGFWKAMLKDA